MLEPYIRRAALKVLECFIALLDPLLRRANADRVRKNVERNREFVEQLEALGYYLYADASELTGLKVEAMESDCPFIFQNNGRFYHADGEDLAENGVVGFLKSLSFFLEHQKVVIRSLQGEDVPDEYCVRVNDAVHVIYTRAEDEEAESKKLGLIWGLTTARTFAIVNKLLAGANSSERLYAIYGGNDLAGVFLTQHLFDFISTHPSVPDSEKPYLPTEDYPWHGQPH